MDANARTGRREKGGVGSKDNKIIGAYSRNITGGHFATCGTPLLSYLYRVPIYLVRGPYGAFLTLWVGYRYPVY